MDLEKSIQSIKNRTETIAQNTNDFRRAVKYFYKHMNPYFAQAGVTYEATDPFYISDGSSFVFGISKTDDDKWEIVCKDVDSTNIYKMEDLSGDLMCAAAAQLPELISDYLELLDQTAIRSKSAVRSVNKVNVAVVKGLKAVRKTRIEEEREKHAQILNSLTGMKNINDIEAIATEIKAWDPEKQSAKSLLELIAEFIDVCKNSNLELDECVDIKSLGVAEKYKENVLKHSDYPIWACDYDGNCLVGDKLKIEHIDTVVANYEVN